MNEPVAWMYEDANGTMKMLSNTRLEEWVTKFGCKEIPLYTHPAKTLTDEEILVLAETYKNGWVENNFERQLFMDAEALVLFARAILRKAQDGHQS